MSDFDWKEFQRVMQRPFDPEDIEWKPGGRGKFAYVEDRRYMERLDEAAGPGIWSTHIEISGREGFVQVICYLAINGTSRSSTGESSLTQGPRENPNALTTAEAQAFKRACTRFGLGRYLYDIPSSVDRTADLPAWAVPKYTCSECSNRIVDDSGFTAGQIRRRSMQSLGKELCMECVMKQKD